MRNNQVGLVVCSLILGLMRTTDKEAQRKGSYIKYFQLMRGKCKNAPLELEDRKKLAIVARDSMLQLVDVYDNKDTMQISTFVLSLSYSFEKELLIFAGNNYFTLMDRYVAKLPEHTEFAKNSYAISDTLRDNIRKLIFEAMK